MGIDLFIIGCAAVIGALIGHDSGKKKGIEEMTELQEYERSRREWEETMRHFRRRDDDDEDH
jgi:hypothetical protein